MFLKLFQKIKNYKIKQINSKSGKEDGIILPLSFGYGLKLKLVKIKRKFLAKRWQYSIVTALLLVFFTGWIWIYQDYSAKGATYGWVQSSWSVADEVNTANHTDDQTTWTKYFSKDDEILVNAEGNLTLDGATSDWHETDDEDFNAGTNSDTYVSGGVLALRKPDGASCAADSECYNDACENNLCRNGWLTGPCAGIEVYYKDVSGTRMWKTSNTSCNTPQCGLDGGQNNLVADNIVDFSEYPARNVCKTFRGRLPTVTELSCIYTNRANYGNNFTTYYWSATEASSSDSLMVAFSVVGGIYSNDKTISRLVRCVKGL